MDTPVSSTPHSRTKGDRLNWFEVTDMCGTDGFVWKWPILRAEKEFSLCRSDVLNWHVRVGVRGNPFFVEVFLNLFTCYPTFICIESSVETVAFDLPFLINTASKNLLIFWSIKIDVNRSDNIQNLKDYSQFKSRDSDSHIFHAEGIFRKFIHFFLFKSWLARRGSGGKKSIILAVRKNPLRAFQVQEIYTVK